MHIISGLAFDTEYTVVIVQLYLHSAPANSKTKAICECI